jgi:hypothetical protein
VLAGILATLASLAVAAPSADAAAWSREGTYDMRGFLSTPVAPFRCSPGYISARQVTVRAPSNYTVHVYITIYAYQWTWNGWQQVSFGNMSPYPGGAVVPAGSQVTIPGGSWRSPAGYYHLVERVDFAPQPSGSFLGTVWISPTLAGDYETGGIQGNGYSYCYHA